MNKSVGVAKVTDPMGVLMRGVLMGRVGHRRRYEGADGKCGSDEQHADSDWQELNSSERTSKGASFQSTCRGRRRGPLVCWPDIQ